MVKFVIWANMGKGPLSTPSFRSDARKSAVESLKPLNSFDFSPGGIDPVGMKPLRSALSASESTLSLRGVLVGLLI